MKLKIYTIYDQKAEAYLPPFYMQNNQMAVRALSDSVNNEEHQFGKYPEDYTLYTLGEFDDSTSIIKQFKESPMLVMTCLSLKAKIKSDREAEFDALNEIIAENKK